MATYTPTTWTDGSGSPLSAANLTNMEQGIVAGNTTSLVNNGNGTATLTAMGPGGTQVSVVITLAS